ncbi:Hypothetical predicted protein [Paramuricea clavata]|uniref:Uncharacterized protein n=1 Tax=Paramuricea clavata TaxID=317549 RepID=A0A6S7H5N2_PARCT|nr:Hypothetical predicted protein [Paramuricea clavata]
MAVVLRTALGVLILIASLRVKKCAFLSPDSVGLSITGNEVSFDIETHILSSLWQAKGGKFNFRVCSSNRSLINLLILMCGDIHSCLGPSPMAQCLSCPACLRKIRNNQSRMKCISCEMFFHMKCFGEEADRVRTCKLCQTPVLDSTDPRIDNCSILNELKDIVESRGIKLIHQNICSLLRKMDELRLMISELKSGIHILTLSETWLAENISDAEIEIAGYRTFRKDRCSKGGGIVAYVRNDLAVVKRTDLETVDVEGLWLEISLPKSHGFLVGVFYRPPDSSDYHDCEFMPKFDAMLDLAIEQGREVIITGDFNCDFLPVKATTSYCKQLKSILRVQYFSQLINAATRITKSSNTLLDLIATNFPQNISRSGVVCTGLSDHEMVYCIRKINWKRSPERIRTVRNYAKYDAAKFCEDCVNVFNNTLVDTSCLSVKELWLRFKSLFTEIADRHAPLMNKKVRSNHPCAWINSEIKKEIRQRDHELKKARKSNSNEDWATYRRTRNKVTNRIRSAKEKYHRNLIYDNSHNPRSFWKTMKKVFPVESKHVATNVLIVLINGKLSKDKQQIANAFGVYFTETVSRLHQSFSNLCNNIGNITSQCFFNRLNSGFVFKFEEVKEQFILNNLHKIDVKKAAGLDNIPPRLLKDTANVIARPLTKIINVSLEQGTVPDDFKLAKVIPVFKKGQPENMDNYRPISVLPTVSKLLEKAVHEQLYRFLTTNHLLNPYQCGFPAVQQCNVLMYADDTVLFFAERDSGVIQNVLTTELENLRAWLMENKLSLNRKKTETMLFGTNANLSKVTNYELSIDGFPLKRVTDYCYLGNTLNANLSWHSHVDNVAMKVGRRIGMLRRLRNNLTLNAAETVYKSFIRPLMEYGDSIWTCCGEQNKGRLEILQKRAARVISRYTRSDDAMESLRWDSLESRRDVHVLKLVKKCILRKCPQFFNNYFVFNRDSSSRITRQSDKLRLPKVRTESAKNSFYYYGCKVFNKSN